MNNSSNNSSNQTVNVNVGNGGESTANSNGGGNGNKPSVQVILAIIALATATIVAVVGNWDKIFKPSPCKYLKKELLIMEEKKRQVDSALKATRQSKQKVSRNLTVDSVLCEQKIYEFKQQIIANECE